MHLSDEKYPLVSVLMTVYNGMPFIEQSVKALLNQTYSHLELIVVNDASTDGTLAYLKSIGDERVIVIGEGKLGRGRALNVGLGHCKGKYIAINDADDISWPERLKLQVEFLEKHPDYGLVGCNFVKVFANNRKERSDKPLDDHSLRLGLSKHSVIQHSCVMVRADLLKQIGGYNEAIEFLFDRDMYLRIAQKAKVANLPDHLVEINRHEQQFFNSTFKGWRRKLFALRYNLKAIRMLKLPTYLYIQRLLEFGWTNLLSLTQSMLRNAKS